MKKKQKVKFEFEGRQTLSDENGNTITAIVTAKKSDTDINWHKVWLDDLAYILNILGEAKNAVFSHIISNLNSENLFIGTIEAIADDVKVHKNTVNQTIIALIQSNFMVRKQIGVYYINPDIISSANSQRRSSLLIKYNDIKDEEV